MEPVDTTNPETLAEAKILIARLRRENQGLQQQIQQAAEAAANDKKAFAHMRQLLANLKEFAIRNEEIFYGFTTDGVC
jgi:hypothetical protein